MALSLPNAKRNSWKIAREKLQANNISHLCMHTTKELDQLSLSLCGTRKYAGESTKT